MGEDPLEHGHFHHRQELFRSGVGEGTQPCSLATQENDSLHFPVVVAVLGVGLVVAVLGVGLVVAVLGGTVVRAGTVVRGGTEVAVGAVVAVGTAVDWVVDPDPEASVSIAVIELGLGIEAPEGTKATV